MKHTRKIRRSLLSSCCSCAWAKVLGQSPGVGCLLGRFAADSRAAECAARGRPARCHGAADLSPLRGRTALRVHLSNAFGIEALHFTSVHIAWPLSPSSPEIDPASDRPLTFAGSADVTVPPGAEFVSDPLEFAVAPLSDLAVTFHLDAPPARETGHPGSRATSYYQHGDIVSIVTCRMQSMWTTGTRLPGLTCGPPGAAAVVALGDSITDGHGATTNGNDRWTDVLAQRLQALPEPATSASPTRASAAITC
jgi:hypothetical protein